MSLTISHPSLICPSSHCTSLTHTTASASASVSIGWQQLLLESKSSCNCDQAINHTHMDHDNEYNDDQYSCSTTLHCPSCQTPLLRCECCSAPITPNRMIHVMCNNHSVASASASDTMNQITRTYMLASCQHCQFQSLLPEWKTNSSTAATPAASTSSSYCPRTLLLLPTINTWSNRLLWSLQLRIQPDVYMKRLEQQYTERWNKFKQLSATVANSDTHSHHDGKDIVIPDSRSSNGSGNSSNGSNGSTPATPPSQSFVPNAQPNPRTPTPASSQFIMHHQSATSSAAAPASSRKRPRQATRLGGGQEESKSDESMMDDSYDEGAIALAAAASSSAAAVPISNAVAAISLSQPTVVQNHARAEQLLLFARNRLLQCTEMKNRLMAIKQRRLEQNAAEDEYDDDEEEVTYSEEEDRREPFSVSHLRILQLICSNAVPIAATAPATVTESHAAPASSSSASSPAPLLSSDFLILIHRYLSQRESIRREKSSVEDAWRIVRGIRHQIRLSQTQPSAAADTATSSTTFGLSAPATELSCTTLHVLFNIFSCRYQHAALLLQYRMEPFMQLLQSINQLLIQLYDSLAASLSSDDRIPESVLRYAAPPTSTPSLSSAEGQTVWRGLVDASSRTLHSQHAIRSASRTTTSSHRTTTAAATSAAASNHSIPIEHHYPAYSMSLDDLRLAIQYARELYLDVYRTLVRKIHQIQPSAATSNETKQPVTTVDIMNDESTSAVAATTKTATTTTLHTSRLYARSQLRGH